MKIRHLLVACACSFAAAGAANADQAVPTAGAERAAEAASAEQGAAAAAAQQGAAAAGFLRLSNDDLCGTSLLGDEGSQGRGDESWNKRLEEFFRSGGGLTLRTGKIEHEGPAGADVVAWFGPPPRADKERPGEEPWVPTDHLHVTRYEVPGSTVIEVSIEQTPTVSSTVYAWFEKSAGEERLAGAAVLVSKDSAASDDNGYFVRSWNEAAKGSVTFEKPHWPRSGDRRLAIDLVFKSRRVGVAGEMRTLVALDRVPEGDPARIGRFLRDAGIVRTPCVHQNLDPDVLDKVRREMELEEARAVIRAAADFVVFDAEHAIHRDREPKAHASVRCPGGRPVAEISLYEDSSGVARQLRLAITNAKSVNDTVYSYDSEGRLRFLRMTSKRRDSEASGLLELWYDEAGNESDSKSNEWIERPRPGTDPFAEVEWVRAHETELRKACEAGW